LKRGLPLEDYVIVSPDAGGVARAKKFQDLINYNLKDPNK